MNAKAPYTVYKLAQALMSFRCVFVTFSFTISSAMLDRNTTTFLVYEISELESYLVVSKSTLGPSQIYKSHGLQWYIHSTESGSNLQFLQYTELH